MGEVTVLHCHNHITTAGIVARHTVRYIRRPVFLYTEGNHGGTYESQGFDVYPLTKRVFFLTLQQRQNRHGIGSALDNNIFYISFLSPSLAI